MHPDASEILLTAIALCLAEIPLFAYFGYYLHSRYQIRLLELTLTIAASTVPMGLLLCLAYPEVEPVRRPILFPAVGLCVAVVFLGALIGLSWIRWLAVQGTWPRLGLLALGWISIPGFFGFMLGMVWGLAPQSGKPVPPGYQRMVGGRLRAHHPLGPIYRTPMRTAPPQRPGQARYAFHWKGSSWQTPGEGLLCCFLWDNVCFVCSLRRCVRGTRVRCLRGVLPRCRSPS